MKEGVVKAVKPSQWAGWLEIEIEGETELFLFHTNWLLDNEPLKTGEKIRYDPNALNRFDDYAGTLRKLERIESDSGKSKVEDAYGQ
jgi:hypothetical protein